MCDFGAISGPALAATLKTIGTVASIGGTIYSGIQANQHAQMQIQQIEDQKKQYAQISAQEEQASNARFQSEIAQQRGQLIASGVTLDSPTAIYLGQNAAREMSFEAQSIRSRGMAQQQTLTNEQAALQARGRQAMFTGLTSAAGRALTAAPDLWPELLA